MATYNIKTVNPHFDGAFKGAEILTIVTRGLHYKKGDIVNLEEFDSVKEVYTGRILLCEVNNVLHTENTLVHNLVNLRLEILCRRVKLKPKKS